MTTSKSNIVSPSIDAYTTSQQAALALSQSSYSGTVEPAAGQNEIQKFTTSSEAAMSLSQATYSGTVEPALKK